jgi:tRNA pseudouridine38-40 synthase
MSEREFMKAFNSLLPHDIVVKDVAFVPMDFDARRSATKKTYRYTILNRDYPAALFYRRCMFVPFPMDIPGMRRAKQYLVGEHDFSAFRASNCEAKNPTRKIHKIDLIKKGDFIYLIFEGNGFLKHMVRNLVGTLVEVGRRRMKAAEVRAILASRDRNRAGPTAQPQGLCLVNVVYPRQKSLGRRKNK